MERSLAARSPIWSLDLLWRPFAAFAGLTRTCLSFVYRRRRLRLALLALLVSLALLGGGWLLLRDSPLVSVQHVQVSGLHGPEAHAIETALSDAARHMSTLDVRPGKLRAAVAPFRVVRDLRVSASFPHGLRIRVIEQLPVAALTVAGARTAVAADGVVLGPGFLSSSLPLVNAGGAAGATTTMSIVGRRVRDASLLGALTVLGAAPAPLAKVVSRVFTGPKGLTVAMHNGLRAYFGDGTRPHAKWLSLARVLADPSSAGASYVDVRLPERPAAGFATGTPPPSTATSGALSTQSEQAGASEATVAALAAGLTAAKGGGSTSPGASTSPGEEPAASSTPKETTSTAAGESAPAGAGETPTTPPAPGG